MIWAKAEDRMPFDLPGPFLVAFPCDDGKYAYSVMEPCIESSVEYWMPGSPDESGMNYIGGTHWTTIEPPV